MRTAAQLYTILGWVIHPIKPPEPGNRNTGKAPFESSWQVRKSPRTDDEINKYFAGTKNNIGLLCGRPSGVTVIDIDDDLLLRELTAGLNTSGWTMSARDNEIHRGHLFFKYDPTLPSQKHHMVGLEVLNDGNNCVLPPSIHYSGGRYRWQDNAAGPAAVTEMPELFKARLLEIFKTENLTKKLLGACRPCFKKFLEDPEKMHGGDGRLFMVSLATELSAAGVELKYSTEDLNKCIHLVSKLVYREDYDQARTDKEIAGIDPSKTWRCETLQNKFYDICSCDQCKKKPTDAAPTPAQAALAKAAQQFSFFTMAQDLQRHVPIIYDPAGAYWIWTDTGYKLIDETDILITLKNALGVAAITGQRNRTEALEAIKITGRERQVSPRDPAWIQFTDQVINYRTGETFSATPDYFFTSPLPHKIGDSEETPQIDKLFEEWAGPAHKQILYEILAYCMVDSYPIHRLFCLIGSGRNGKGQYMKLLRKFLGVENVTSTELERIEESRFETAKLFQKMAAFIGETNFSTMSKTNRLKQLSGGDVVTGERKRQSPFDFINTAKIIIATNSLPVTQDRTDGFYSRWLVVDFFNRFTEGRDVIDPIPEKEYENLARKCLRILKELLERGGFDQEGTIEDRARAYEDKSNPVKGFIKSQCYQAPEGTSPLWELFEAYDIFQNQNGYRTITKRQFSIQLQELGYDMVRAGTNESFRGFYVIGLRLRKYDPGIQLQFITQDTAPLTTAQEVKRWETRV